MTDECEGIIEEEVGALEAIYIHELEVKRNERNEVIEMVLHLHPATADNLDQQYVCMTLVLGIPSQYPNEPPNIQIRNPRGIGEEEVQSTLEAMVSLCKERTGEAMLYELIELAKESLTEGNIPRCACMICLEHFEEEDNFRKTSCYHYFHEECLGRYVKHVLSAEPEAKPAHLKVEEKRLLCPVCREEINYSEDNFPETPVEEKIIYYPSAEMKKLQAERAAMLEKQRQNGGLIDLVAEKNKFLIKPDDVVYMTPTSSKENCEQEPDEDLKRDDRPGEEGSKPMTNEVRGSRYANRNHFDREARGKGRGRTDRNRRDHGERREGKEHERDDYSNDSQKDTYRYDNHETSRNHSDLSRSDLRKKGENKSPREPYSNEGGKSLAKRDTNYQRTRYNDNRRDYKDSSYKSQSHRPQSSKTSVYRNSSGHKTLSKQNDGALHEDNNQCRVVECYNDTCSHTKDSQSQDLSDRSESGLETLQVATSAKDSSNKSQSGGPKEDDFGNRENYSGRPAADKRRHNEQYNEKFNEDRRIRSGRNRGERQGDGQRVEDRRDKERHAHQNKDSRRPTEWRRNREGQADAQRDFDESGGRFGERRRHIDERKSSGKDDHYRNDHRRSKEYRTYSDRQMPGKTRYEHSKEDKFNTKSIRGFHPKRQDIKHHVSNADARIEDSDIGQKNGKTLNSNSERQDSGASEISSISNSVDTSTHEGAHVKSRHRQYSNDVKRNERTRNDRSFETKSGNENSRPGRGRGRGYNRRNDVFRSTGSKDDHHKHSSRTHEDIVEKFSDLIVITDDKSESCDKPSHSSDVKNVPNDLPSKPSRPPGFEVKPPPGF